MTDDYETRVFAADTEIFRAGDQGDHAYIIDDGEVEIAIPVGAGQWVLNRLGPGQLFGEMALIDGDRRSGTARAVADTRLRVISGEQIRDRVSGADKTIAFILRMTLMRYRGALQQLRRAGGGQTGSEFMTFERPAPDFGDAVAELEKESDLRQALERGRLRMLYQPIVALGDGRVTGFEALMRWETPTRGLVMPEAFVPLAEETGLIVPMCRWALGASMAALTRFQAALDSTDERGTSAQRLTMSVNVTTHQVGDDETIAMIDQIASAATDDAVVSPSCLKFELTEGVLMNDIWRTQEWIAQLKARGVKLSLDDFGTGYSSLVYLHRFGVDELKIDRSFVGEMLSEPRSMEIVRAVIGLAHGLGVSIVAEGIETMEQAAVLREAGCEFGQGYLFGRPQAEADLLARILAGAPGFDA